MRTGKTLIRLSLRWAHMSFCLFCHDAAQIAFGSSKKVGRNLTFISVCRGITLCEMSAKQRKGFLL